MVFFCHNADAGRRPHYTGRMFRVRRGGRFFGLLRPVELWGARVTPRWKVLHCPALPRPTYRSVYLSLGTLTLPCCKQTGDCYGWIVLPQAVCVHGFD